MLQEAERFKDPKTGLTTTAYADTLVRHLPPAHMQPRLAAYDTHVTTDLSQCCSWWCFQCLFLSSDTLIYFPKYRHLLMLRVRFSTTRVLYCFALASDWWLLMGLCMRWMSGEYRPGKAKEKALEKTCQECQEKVTGRFTGLPIAGIISAKEVPFAY